MNRTNLAQKYIEIWNERDAGRRRSAIDAVLTEDSVYSDPDWEAVEGRDGIDTMIGRAREKFGDLAFSLGEVINERHDLMLFTWHLGRPGEPPVATGYDVVRFEKESIRRIDGFFV
ncbi:nuclear transport factor 2 family protein [Streptosporangium minutum]|uniref:SnoaL-like domain-containing protein n=1 Tax=Streptosporangium minutum TaxID=569862 RepID=A0A243RSI3_9ACTN|nr:nuclear transport factor 2 family protein [Streptosporangium minutum]OUC98017.1 hypothetical protein CA984_08740 [Streptosporangium minutum]